MSWPQVCPPAAGPAGSVHRCGGAFPSLCAGKTSHSIGPCYSRCRFHLLCGHSSSSSKGEGRTKQNPKLVCCPGRSLRKCPGQQSPPMFKGCVGRMGQVGACIHPKRTGEGRLWWLLQLLCRTLWRHLKNWLQLQSVLTTRSLPFRFGSLPF